MRIALTSLYLPSGSKIGVGYQVHGLANALIARGHEVVVFSSCPRPEGALYDVRMSPVRNRLRTFQFAWDLRRINFDSFDILNAHGDDWFLWGVRRPWHVHTFHGSCFAEMLNIQGIKGKVRMGLLAVCETQAILLADETVAVSENTRRYIPGIRHVVPCGVDLKAFTGHASKSERPSILFVGTMHGRKRGRMLLNAFLQTVQKVLPSAELWCVCDRPADLRETPGVRWLSRVSSMELVELYARAWVFCLPSTYEGFGVPYIEAMASGTPVVATANPGALEVLQAGSCGLISADNELGENLCSLLNDSKGRERLATRGRSRAMDFSWEVVCHNYETLYRARGAVPVPA